MSQMQGLPQETDGAIIDGVSPSIKATVLDLPAANPLTVAVTDASGNQITSFGGGTQYTEGDADASITGTAMMMEDAGNTLRPAQGSVVDGLLVNLGANNDIQGVDADGAAVTAKPVLIGGEDPSGNVKRLQTAADGDLVVHQHSASTALADGVGNTMHIPINQTDLGFLGTPVAGYVFNGTTWDRMRGDATNGVTVNTELTTADLDTGAGTDTRAVVGMVLAESGGGVLVGSANPMPVRVKLQGATITESSVNDATTDTTLLAANASRVEVFILNDSTANLRVSLSATATTTSPYLVRAGESLTLVPNPDGKMYLGEISGIWDADTSGAARIVEIT